MRDENPQRMCTSLAPASRRLTTRARAVVPSSDDGIIDHDHAFPFHRFLDQIEFHPHIEVANKLARLKKVRPM